MNGDDLFALTGESNMTEEAERMHVVCLEALSAVMEHHGTAEALDSARAIIQAGADWLQLNAGIVVAHDLTAQVANEKWRAMLAGKKRAAA
jgi:hypothetical protein